MPISRSSPDHRFIFVYGSLKRGEINHLHLEGQRFIAVVRTVRGFTLYEVGGYPGMVSSPGDTQGVTGELWEVDPAALVRLDEFEGLGEQLYVRQPVALGAPHEGVEADAYFYARAVTGRPALGSTWTGTASH